MFERVTHTSAATSAWWGRVSASVERRDCWRVVRATSLLLERDLCRCED